jgi:hypothetical protein
MDLTTATARAMHIRGLYEQLEKTSAWELLDSARSVYRIRL